MKHFGGGEAMIAEATEQRLKTAYLVTCLKPGVLEGFARSVLLHLYCETHSACGACAACRKIISESAVDVHWIRPNNGTIKVGQIRELKGFLYEKPFEAETKAVVILEADRMTPAAQNALLKPLEDPPKDTVFLIFSQSDFGLLPTVISRCENVRLVPPDQQTALSILIDKGISKAQAELMLKLSGGYIEEAERIANDSAYLDLREKTIKAAKKLLDQRTYAVTNAVDFIEANKDRIQNIVDVLKLFFSDILKAQFGNSDLIVNIDYKDAVAAYADIFTSAAIYNMIERLLVYEQRMRSNVNFRLTIESMLFDILKEKYQWLR